MSDRDRLIVKTMRFSEWIVDSLIEWFQLSKSGLDPHQKVYDECL